MNINALSKSSAVSTLAAAPTQSASTTAADGDGIVSAAEKLIYALSHPNAAATSSASSSSTT